MEEVWERARLDVSFDDADGRQTHVDVSFANAATITADEQRRRATHAGRAAAQREGDKRRRYKQADNPSEPLVVFAIEGRGRLGEAALQLLRSLAPVDASRPTAFSTVLYEKESPKPYGGTCGWKPLNEQGARTRVSQRRYHARLGERLGACVGRAPTGGAQGYL